MLRKLALCVILIALALPSLAGETFKDMPDDHWAAEAVKMLADAGIVSGFPDGTFKGDKPITRYELAAILGRFIEFMEESQKSLIEDKKESKQSEGFGTKNGAEASKQPKGLGAKNGAEASTSSVEWGKKAMVFLKDGGYLPKDSKLLKDGDKPVSAQELAEALSSVARKLIEKQTPAAAKS